MMSAVLIAVFAFGCGKDRTVEDYQHDRVAELKAQIRAVAGAYTGKLVFADGTTGDIELQLAEDTQLNDSRSSIAVTPQASLQGSVKFVSQGALRVLSFHDGFFDAGSGDFKAEVSVKQRSGDVTTIEVSGTISDDSVDGSLAATTYEEASGHFHATRGASTESGSLISGRGTAAPVVYTRKYHADVPFSDGTTRSMALVVTNANSSSEQAFYDTFSPLKWVDVQLQDLGDAGSASDSSQNVQSIPFSDATWDQRNGQLYARLSQSGGSPDSVSLALRCQEQTRGTTTAWNCSYYSYASLVFQVLFTE